MLSQANYQTAIQAIAPRLGNPNINWGSWYTQYAFYEGMWNSYFIRFLTLRPADIPITFVFWESCPGGVPFPHQNYAFHLGRVGNVIHGTFDAYLCRVCKRFKIRFLFGSLRPEGGPQFDNFVQNRAGCFFHVQCKDCNGSSNGIKGPQRPFCRFFS